MSDALHPNIDGTVLSPGSEVVENATEEHATRNIEQLIRDVALNGVAYRRHSTRDDEGRFGYQLHCKDTTVEVEMPGLPLDKVRYLDGTVQNPWLFPRLYVDRNSWLWKYATSTIHSAFKHHIL